jgi:hypothetical protein
MAGRFICKIVGQIRVWPFGDKRMQLSKCERGWLSCARPVRLLLPLCPDDTHPARAVQQRSVYQSCGRPSVK